MKKKFGVFAVTTYWKNMKKQNKNETVKRQNIKIKELQMLLYMYT